MRSRCDTMRFENCPICGDAFFKLHNMRYCGKTCFGIQQYARSLAWRKANPKRLKDLSHKYHKTAYADPVKRKKKLAANKAWREANPEAARASHTKYVANNRAAVNKASMRHYNKRVKTKKFHWNLEQMIISSIVSAAREALE